MNDAITLFNFQKRTGKTSPLPPIVAPSALFGNALMVTISNLMYSNLFTIN